MRIGVETLEGKGAIVGKKAPDFSLVDQKGKPWALSDVVKDSAVLMVFYPGDFKPVCTKQLCNYRDRLNDFARLGVRVVGISSNLSESHEKFSKEYELTFPLLSDPAHVVAKQYGCTSFLMLGAVSRAVCIVNKKSVLLYRYVEPTTLTRRTTPELIGILEDLRNNQLI